MGRRKLGEYVIFYNGLLRFLRAVSIGARVSAIVVVLSAAVIAPRPAIADVLAAEAIEEYFDFATAAAGIILAEQITDDLKPDFQFIDARSKVDHEAGTIEGAIHMEWRTIFARRAEIPKDKPVVVFCNTGVRSSQAVFALRVVGWENVVVLQKGYEGWREVH